MAISQAERLAKSKKARPVWLKLKRGFHCVIAGERKRLGLTMREVTRRCGVTSTGSLSRIEHGGNLELGTAFHLAEFFGKRIEELWQPLDGNKEKH